MAQTWILNETLPKRKINTTWEFNFESNKLIFDGIEYSGPYSDFLFTASLLYCESKSGI